MSLGGFFTIKSMGILGMYLSTPRI